MYFNLNQTELDPEQLGLREGEVLVSGSGLREGQVLVSGSGRGSGSGQWFRPLGG